MIAIPNHLSFWLHRHKRVLSFSRFNLISIRKKVKFPMNFRFTSATPSSLWIEFLSIPACLPRRSTFFLVHIISIRHPSTQKHISGTQKAQKDFFVKIFFTHIYVFSPKTERCWNDNLYVIHIPTHLFIIIFNHFHLFMLKILLFEKKPRELRQQQKELNRDPLGDPRFTSSQLMFKFQIQKQHAQ